MQENEKRSRKMKRNNHLILILLLILFSLFLSACTTSSEGIAANEPSKTKLMKVTKINDGDTIVIEGNEKIRFLMVDTPEVYNVDSPEPYGEQASEFTKELLTGKQVSLEYDIEREDPYGRTLAYVYLPDGRMVNEMLLEEGLAKVVVYEPNDKYEEKFREIEDTAKKSKQGIWGIE